MEHAADVKKDPNKRNRLWHPRPENPGRQNQLQQNGGQPVTTLLQIKKEPTSLISTSRKVLQGNHRQPQVDRQKLTLD